MRATAAGLSLSQYLLEELTRVAARSDVVEALERAANLAPGLSTKEIVEAVRAGREERDAELFFRSPGKRQNKVAER